MDCNDIKIVNTGEELGEEMSGLVLIQTHLVPVDKLLKSNEITIIKQDVMGLLIN
ncbi:unnamed protein product [Brugia timori]|uniref:PTS EIIA type-1 domain-containing protein n=1 Tax=Brugia timori TaxID=42155 RepID=A0A0R3QYG5_9BILA|nr:unnamed protein product [Brugia timori]